jgi:hypothetical protein
MTFVIDIVLLMLGLLFRGFIFIITIFGNLQLQYLKLCPNMSLYGTILIYLIQLKSTLLNIVLDILLKDF